MRKILDRVTITGADSRTDISQMAVISEQFPWVEWGILLSENAMGKKPRYPSKEWMLELHDSRAMLNGLCVFSGHLCGKWVRDVCKGKWGFVYDLGKVCEIFYRYQLNFSGIVDGIKDHAAFVKGFESVDPWTDEFIFQLKNVDHKIIDVARDGFVDAQPCFDLSGGHGRLPEQWTESRGDLYTGYAGGLSPKNIQDQLEQIEGVCGDVIWIDVETGVRTDDQLDMNKVEEFLKYSEPWVCDDWQEVRQSRRDSWP